MIMMHTLFNDYLIKQLES